MKLNQAFLDMLTHTRITNVDFEFFILTAKTLCVSVGGGRGRRPVNELGRNGTKEETTKMSDTIQKVKWKWVDPSFHGNSSWSPRLQQCWFLR